MTIAGIVLVAIAAAAWWFLAGPATSTAPDWERLTTLDLAAPAGDAFQDGTPWINLIINPARPGEANSLSVSLRPPPGTPVPLPPAGEVITALAARPLSGAAEPLNLTPDVAGALEASAPLDHAGWWKLSVTVDGSRETADFYLLLPDPNLNGPGAVQVSESSPEGEALFQRGLDAIHALRTVRFTQWLADGRANVGVSQHAVSAGGDGTPAAFTYRALSGMDAVVIDSTRWILLPGELGWERQEGATVVPPSEWGEEYLGATGFTILGEETIDGEPCQLLAFVVPEVTEPRRQSAAWYLWWVGTETGHVRREAMVSRVHYMLNQFSDFDAPLEIVPPEMASPVPNGTPPA
jgi:hypothetical protein